MNYGGKLYNIKCFPEGDEHENTRSRTFVAKAGNNGVAQANPRISLISISKIIIQTDSQTRHTSRHHRKIAFACKKTPTFFAYTYTIKIKYHILQRTIAEHIVWHGTFVIIQNKMTLTILYQGGKSNHTFYTKQYM